MRTANVALMTALVGLLAGATGCGSSADPEGAASDVARLSPVPPLRGAGQLICQAQSPARTAAACCAVFGPGAALPPGRSLRTCSMACPEPCGTGRV